MRRSILLLGVVLLALLAAMATTPLLIRVPEVRDQASAGEFNATRAKARLAFLLGDQRPHPTDTPANDQVRTRLVGLLSGMGLRPLVRDQIACNELYKSRGVSCARVRNVVVRLGASTGRALLLNAHYDSSPVGPGAGDAGIGVATLLEVAAILNPRALQRPLILLFNEGEELGLIGARAFLADPLSRNIDSLINLEARGVRGPVNMFETSRPNGSAIAVYSRAVENPVANSLSTDVYRLMPNYTDVNSFSERGWLTLNLAPIGNETRYHSAGDNIAALDPRTLQHMGDQTLALARALSSGTPQGSGNRVFMDVGGRMLVTLPLVVGVILLIALIGAFAIVVRARGQVLRSAIVAVGTILLSTASAWAVLALLEAIRPGMFWRAHPLWTHLSVYATVALVGVLLLAWIGRRVGPQQLRAVFWLTYLLIGAGIGAVAPGGIVFFLFPPLLSLAGMIATRWWRPAERAGAIAAIALLYLTWGAMLGLLQELLNSGPMWVFAPLGALLILPVVIEAKALIDGSSPASASATGGVIVLFGWAAVAAAPAYSADRKQRFVIEHVTDAQTGKAYWSVLNGAAPIPQGYRAVGDWRRGKLPYAEARRWLATAPPLEGVRPPIVAGISMLRHGAQRTIVARLHANGAERIMLIAPEDAQIRSAGTAGFVRPIDAALEDGKYLIVCSGRSCDGLELTITVGQAGPVQFTVVGARSGLPGTARPLVSARPRFAQPQYAPDQTIVFTRVRL